MSIIQKVHHHCVAGQKCCSAWNSLADNAVLVAGQTCCSARNSLADDAVLVAGQMCCREWNSLKDNTATCVGFKRMHLTTRISPHSLNARHDVLSCRHLHGTVKLGSKHNLHDVARSKKPSGTGVHDSLEWKFLWQLLLQESYGGLFEDNPKGLFVRVSYRDKGIVNSTYRYE